MKFSPLFSSSLITGRPSPQVRWLVNGLTVDEQTEQQTGDLTENRLMWPQIQRSDLNSIFTCQAINTPLVDARESSYVLDMHCKFLYFFFIQYCFWLITLQSLHMRERHFVCSFFNFFFLSPTHRYEEDWNLFFTWVGSNGHEEEENFFVKESVLLTCVWSLNSIEFYWIKREVRLGYGRRWKHMKHFPPRLISKIKFNLEPVGDFFFRINLNL